MDAVWLDIPSHILEERARLGIDKKDELWEGVLHMVPPPSGPHERRTFDLLAAMIPVARRRGLSFWAASTGLFAPDVDPQSWRIPDVVLSRPEHESPRGLESAALVVEVLSPHDESRKKFGFFARVGVSEVWILDPHTREPEIYALIEGAYVRIASEHGVHRSPLLGITLHVVAGPLLRITDGDDTTEL